MFNNTNNSILHVRGTRGSWLVATVLAALALVAPIGQAAPARFRPTDINRDGSVNSFDLAILLSDYRGDIPIRERGARSDLNHDGFVNSVDLGILLADMR